MTLTLKVAENAEPGSYPIQFANELMVETNTASHPVKNVTCQLTIPAQDDPTAFDLNKDGKVDIADITTLVEYITTHKDLNVQ